MNQTDQKWLLQLARKHLTNHLNQISDHLPKEIPEVWQGVNGIFVTLTKNGDLRGCIGVLEGREKIYQTVWDYVINAATQDPRFPPVTPDELNSIDIEISLLTTPEPLSYSSPEELLSKLDHNTGLIFRYGYRRSTFLPQVWEQLPDKIDFLQHLSMKAGCAPDQWKSAEFQSYRVIHFSEQEFNKI